MLIRLLGPVLDDRTDDFRVADFGVTDFVMVDFVIADFVMVDFVIADFGVDEDFGATPLLSGLIELDLLPGLLEVDLATADLRLDWIGADFNELPGLIPDTALAAELLIRGESSLRNDWLCSSRLNGRSGRTGKLTGDWWI